MGQCVGEKIVRKSVLWIRSNRLFLTTWFTQFPCFHRVEINLRHDSGVHRVCLSQLVSAIVNICLPETRMKRRRDEGCNRDEATPSIARLKLMASARFPWSVLFAPHAPHTCTRTRTRTYTSMRPCTCECTCMYACARRQRGRRQGDVIGCRKWRRQQQFPNALQDYVNFHLDRFNSAKDWIFNVAGLRDLFCCRLTCIFVSNTHLLF